MKEKIEKKQKHEILRKMHDSKSREVWKKYIKKLGKRHF